MPLTGAAGAASTVNKHSWLLSAFMRRTPQRRAGRR
jgi:hypothetical protein